MYKIFMKEKIALKLLTSGVIVLKLLAVFYVALGFALGLTNFSINQLHIDDNLRKTQAENENW